MSELGAAARRFLPFLRVQPPLASTARARILVAGSGSRANVVRALEIVHARFPDAHVVLLASPAAQPAPAGDYVESVIAWRGMSSSLRVRRELQGVFDLKVVLFTGEGQTQLKLFAFTLPAPRMLVFTEGGGAFGWSFNERLAIWNHLKWRLGSGMGLPALARRLARAVTNPVLAFVAFVLLLLWHGGLLVRRAYGRWGRR